MAGRLIICPTPLGNLGDMPPRAVEALAAADTVCAEDTRVTGKLLAALGVSVRLERLDEAMIGKRAAAVVARIADGETIAFCSDAGMPGVSDPGARLIAAAREAGVPVEVLPGPTAAATAYVASGFSCPRFYFGGFFPRKAGERTTVLSSLATLDAVLVFYESPHRTASALAAIAAAFPTRKVAVCRELTKLHEEVFVADAAGAAAEFARREADGEVRGEVVLVVDVPDPDQTAAEHAADREDAAERAERLLAEGTMTRRDIVEVLTREYPLNRNEAYDLVHSL